MDLQKNDKSWAIVALASVPLIMTLGNSMLIPVLPVMEEKIPISKVQSSYIITVYSIVAIFCIPIAGYLSDRFGRKKVMIPALIITALGGLIAGLAAWKMTNPFAVIIIGRILQGIGASGAMPIVFPFVGDMFRREEEVSATLGVIETSNTVGKVLSPILGAGLMAIVWYIPFFAIPIFCVISILLIIFLIKKEVERDGMKFATYWGIIRETFQAHKRWLIAIFIIGAIFMFILFGFLFYLSNILEEKHKIFGVKKGLLLAIPLLSLSIASYVTGKKIKHDVKLMKWIIFVGTILAGASVAIIAMGQHFAFLLVLFFICGAGIGIALPCLDAMLTNSLEKEVLGAITSIYSAMRFIGVAAGPPVIALLMKEDVLYIVALFTSLALITSFISFKFIKPEAP